MIKYEQPNLAVEKNLNDQLLLNVVASKISSTSPFLKWAGGKRQLLPHIRAFMPANFDNYYEPFVGAGAVLFDLKPQNATISDVNSELINCYRVIKELCLDLIEDLKLHTNTKEYFYKIREIDRAEAFNNLSIIERASRIIYLNKTCYNGLFRVNSRGEFNAPYGRYKSPNIINAETLKSISFYLNENNINIVNSDFSLAVETAQRGDFIYFDPPYDPISPTASFTGYNLNQFGKTEQERLKQVFERLTARGCFVMLSNSSTQFIKDLYQDYRIVKIHANRNINSIGSGRRKVEELLVLNY